MNTGIQVDTDPGKFNVHVCPCEYHRLWYSIFEYKQTLHSINTKCLSDKHEICINTIVSLEMPQHAAWFEIQYEYQYIYEYYNNSNYILIM